MEQAPDVISIDTVFVQHYRVEVSTGPRFPARPAKFLFGPAPRPAINLLQNLY